MASVRFDNIDDERYVVLGSLMGMDEFAAIGRMAKIYKYCTDRQTYLVSEVFIKAVTRLADFPKLMVEADLAEVVKGQYRIKGTAGRIEWLAKLRENAKLGGAARKNANRDEHGHFSSDSQTEDQPNASQMGGNIPAKPKPNASQTEANSKPESSPLTLTITPTLSLSKTITKTKSLSKEKDVSTERSPSADRFDAPLPEFSDPVIKAFFFLAKIKPSTQSLWLKTYEDPGWLKQEFLKIIAWLDANPQKKPKKNYARFIGAWLSRGWEWHRKNLTSNKTDNTDWSKVFSDEPRSI